jgi:CheY-like chemotaxis protein
MGYHLQNNNLNVYVSDTGIGIPIARQAHVFDRFVQADIEDKSVYEGSGLGLTISKSYAIMLGGDIYLKSTEGQGATFTFTLPIQNNTITIKSEQNNLNINNHPTPLTNNQLNVLIVDDETTVQLYLQEILFKNTHQLFVASNGIEALEILKNNPSINLVLLDIQMPKMNGFDVAMHIRTFNKKVVIIAQTALTQPADKEKALAIGCNDYISKPIIKDELFLKIETLF